MARIPSSTYRMQFHKDFRLGDGEALVGYLDRLGIGDLYASPILTARAGSLHGYDVTDPTRLNPELGGEEAFRSLADALRQHEMGLVLDIVPNHMAASLENPWWHDVLRHGRRSPYATFFDIDWHSTVPGLAGKVLLPILGGPFGEVLERGELKLAWSANGFIVRYFDRDLPLSPESHALIEGNVSAEQAVQRINGLPGAPTSFGRLERLLEAQHYRLAHWQVARDAINYRRFFDVNDLVSLRAEDGAVFEATHERILALANNGDMTGLRIDHIDGLRDPAGYLERLQSALPRQQVETHDGDGPNRFYVVVEKILATDESMPEDWQAEGTSGYGFLNVLNRLFVDRRSESELDDIYGRLRGAPPDFDELVYQRKHQVMAELFAGDVHRLALDLWQIAAKDRAGHDLMLNELETALIEIIAHLNVYRTYVRSSRLSSSDRDRIDEAVAGAQARNPQLNAELDFARAVLTLNGHDTLDGADRERWLAFVMSWQQLTGPVMAKGFEDTSLYVYNRLISLNEVGGDPDPLGVPLAVFNAWAATRQERWHGALNASSTHDTKRSEDVRARINVLSEMAVEWGDALARWQGLNRDKKVVVDGSLAPDDNEEHLIYETMLGAWPFSLDEVGEFRERLRAYVIKAAREAKTHSSWIDRHGEYEAALTGFVDRLIPDRAADAFLTDFQEFQRTIAFHGALNSLSQTLLKICLPGVPDFYQGSELWNLSLVDPDNRRPVDYQRRADLLEDLLAADGPDLIEHLVRDWDDGRIKLFLIVNALRTRREMPVLFSRGTYIPIAASGDLSRHVVAFARHHEDDWALVAVPRLTVDVARQRGLPLGEAPLGDRFWNDMAIAIPETAPDRWQNALTGESFTCRSSGLGRTLPLSALFGRLPVAFLTVASLT